MTKKQLESLHTLLYCVLAGVMFGADNPLVTIGGIVLIVAILVLNRMVKKREETPRISPE